jgi:hypothetical protein
MRRYFKNGSSFPDYSGDGTITQKDILMGKGVIPKAKMMGGGSVKRMGLKAGSANPKATSETAKKQAKAGMESQKSTNKKALKIAKNISKLNPLTFGLATALDTSKKDKKNESKTSNFITKKSKFITKKKPKEILEARAKTRESGRGQLMAGGRVKRAAGGPGLYANIKAKKDRIAAGSGETMRKVGSVGAPTAQNFKDAAKTAKKV